MFVYPKGICQKFAEQICLSLRTGEFHRAEATMRQAFRELRETESGGDPMKFGIERLDVSLEVLDVLGSAHQMDTVAQVVITSDETILHARGAKPEMIKEISQALSALGIDWIETRNRLNSVSVRTNRAKSSVPGVRRKLAKSIGSS